MNPVAQTFQSAVSRVFNPQAPSITDGPGNLNALAQTNARPTESRRYSRLKTCATTFRFRGSGPGADATGCHGYRGAHNGAVAFKTITGPIFEFGFPDAILQMWAAFLHELVHRQPPKRFAGCVTPAEVSLSHRLFTAALQSQKSRTVVTV